MRGVYKRALPSAASTVGYIPSRVDLFSIPFFFDYIYTARSAIYYMKQKATDERKHDTKHHLSYWARRPPTHWRRLFLKKSLRSGFSLFCGGALGVRVLMTAKCERPSEPCWRLYTPPMYVVYTVKELSTIYIGVESVGCSRSEHH